MHLLGYPRHTPILLGQMERYRGYDYTAKCHKKSIPYTELALILHHNPGARPAFYHNPRVIYDQLTPVASADTHQSFLAEVVRHAALLDQH